VVAVKRVGTWFPPSVTPFAVWACTAIRRPTPGGYRHPTHGLNTFRITIHIDHHIATDIQAWVTGSNINHRLGPGIVRIRIQVVVVMMTAGIYAVAVGI